MTDGALELVRVRDEESALEAAFVPGAGMLCCSLRHRGEELLAQNAGVAAYAQRGKTMGIPLLYPWANRLAGFDYSLAGRTVLIPHDPSRVRLDANGLPIHGVIGGRMAWELTGAPERDASSLAARLSWSDAQPALFELFPFRHDLRYGRACATAAWRSSCRCTRAARTPFRCRSAFTRICRCRAPARALADRAAGDARAGARPQADPDRSRADAGAPALRAGRRGSSTTGSTRVAEPARFGVAGAGRRIELRSCRAIRARRCSRPAPGSSSASSR